MRRQKAGPSVVDAVAQQTEEAAGLARIEGQHRLASPHTNPAVRSHADQLRDDEHRRALNALHTRALRRHRVADNRAANAERALEAIQAARETSSAARSVLALHKGRTRFMGAALGASLTLSVGSAIGVAALAVKHGSPILIGYIAEVGLTGLATTVILYRSHLAQHGQKLEGWKDKVLWALMIGPLLASIVANAYGTGGVGVACSVGAAAFSLLSYVMADASAEALQAKAKLVSETDELELRTIATGDEPTNSRTANHDSSEPKDPRTSRRELEVLEPAVTREPLLANLSGEPMVREHDTSSEVRELEAEVEVLEPANLTVREPAAATAMVRPEPANLVDRAARSEAEVLKVVDLIRQHGRTTLVLPMVVDQLGFGKTKAHHRLKAARELWDANPELANPSPANSDKGVREPQADASSRTGS